MRAVLKLLFIVIILALLVLGFNSIVLNSYATSQLSNTFVASSTNLDKIETNQNNVVVPSNSAKTYSEFTEQTINKSGFYIRIDKIGLFKQVVKDVDPKYQEVYVKSWETGVSQGKFTAYPDQIGITYIFGHAVGDKSKALEQNAWFSNLDQLVQNDKIVLYYDYYKYTYSVTEIRIVSPDATGFYTGASPVAMVRLQYCGPPTGSLNFRTLIDGILISKEKII